MPRGYEIAQLPGSAHASFTAWPQNLGHPSHSRTNYTCKNPDKYLSCLHLRAFQRGDPTAFPGTAVLCSAISLMWQEKCRACFKDHCFYLIHPNVQIFSLLPPTVSFWRLEVIHLPLSTVVLYAKPAFLRAHYHVCYPLGGSYSPQTGFSFRWPCWKGSIHNFHFLPR